MAERLVQVRGFNGFSYADVAAELKITKAALHYHFAGKAELGEALVGSLCGPVRRHARRGWRHEQPDPSAMLDAYADLYLEVLREQRMCLCGMMAAEYQTLPAPMQDAVLRFFEENERWLVRVLETGRKEGTLAFGGRPASGPHDRQRPGRGDARGQTLRRHHPVSEHRPFLARRTPRHPDKRREASKRVEGVVQGRPRLVAVS